MSTDLDPIASLRPLLTEVGDAKRIRDASAPGSLSERAFARSWARLCSGEDPQVVAASETAAAVARARLAGIDAAVLRRTGLDEQRAREVLTRAFDEVGGALDPGLVTLLRAQLGRATEPDAAPPALVATLNAQPRAGATAPGVARLIVEPPESHGDHCFTVAVYGALLAPVMGADPVVPFLTGLAHHLHNVELPDAGFAGEVLLGDDLEPVLVRLEREQLDLLPAALADVLTEALAVRADADSPAGRAFHAADVLDRVLQVHHHARAAAFTASQALDDLELVHAGPVQHFHHQVLAAAGL